MNVISFLSIPTINRRLLVYTSKYDKNRESVSWEDATCPQLILDYKYSGSLNVVDMKRLPEIESLSPIESFQ